MSTLIHSCYSSLKEAIQGTKAPPEIVKTLVLVDLFYYSFDGRVHAGQAVMHEALEDDLRQIFGSLLALRFPLAKVIPIVFYDWDDDASMADNNCSGFNYRLIKGTDRLSKHSLGTAFDINPAQNPYFARDGKVYPEGAVYDSEAPGTVTPQIVSLFKDKGWIWGGDWTVPVDYQHFEKPL